MITTDRETIKYYAGEAAEYSGFSEKINGMKMSPTVPFISLLPPGGTILDAGCGPGRDSSMFKKHSYGVSALDACQEMVEACVAHGVTAIRASFEEIPNLWPHGNHFDGVWACHSLLHVPKPGLELATDSLLYPLKRGGCAMVSWIFSKEPRRDGHGRFYQSGKAIMDIMTSRADMAWDKVEYAIGGIRPSSFGGSRRRSQSISSDEGRIAGGTGGRART